MADKLARVRWELGQTLLPEHFVSQEESFLSDVALRFRFSGKPFYGIGRVQWNETLLIDGIFSIEILSFVLPSGLLIDLNGNADIVSEQLSFKDEESVEVYIHILEEKPRKEFIEFDNNVYKNIYKLVLSLDQDLVASDDLFNESKYRYLDTFRLAKFNSVDSNIWKLNNDFVPALLQVGSSAFLREGIENTAKLLSHYQYELKKQFKLNHKKNELNGPLSHLILSIYACMRMIHNIEKEIQVYPFELFKTLQELYIEIKLFQNDLIDNLKTVYEHRKLANIFNELFDLYEDAILIKYDKYEIYPLDLLDGIYSVDFPKKKQSYNAPYLVVEYEKAEDLKKLVLPKISTRNRLPEVHLEIIEGVRLKKINKSDITKQFENYAECYQVINSSEWKHVLKDKNIAYYAQSYLKQFKFSLILEKASK